mmetsp:Transcript_948/g.2363  ORF Transcript_948/g.2363 Transcript_948/m.2363 type:complete len:83 (+) Transcript_948:774-1022(+)
MDRLIVCDASWPERLSQQCRAMLQHVRNAWDQLHPALVKQMPSSRSFDVSADYFIAQPSETCETKRLTTVLIHQDARMETLF